MVLEHDDRPWGSYDVLEDAETHKVKRISVLPGQRLSYQRHARRAEHWFVIKGICTVTLDGVEHEIESGTSIDIPQGSAHRAENRSKELVEFIEVQFGTYFGEDDIERLEDDYGRQGTNTN